MRSTECPSSFNIIMCNKVKCGIYGGVNLFTAWANISLVAYQKLAENSPLKTRDTFYVYIA